MAYKGWIDYPQAAAIILGENIGTTITAYLASLTANTAAKRAARAHFVFNIVGVIWMLILFYPFISLVDHLMPGLPGSSDGLPNHLALFHTLFNLVNISLLIAFVPKIASLVEWMVKERPERKLSHFRYLDTASWGSGELNFFEAQQAIRKLGELSKSMFDQFLYIYSKPHQDLSKKVEQLRAMEAESNAVTTELFEFMTHCASDQLSDETRREATQYLRVVAELEAVCDCCNRLTNRAAERYKENQFVTQEIEDDILEFGESIQRFIDLYLSRLESKVAPSDIEMAFDLEKQIDENRIALRKRAVNRMINHDSGIYAELIYIEIINTFERIANHSRNILQSLPHE